MELKELSIVLLNHAGWLLKSEYGRRANLSGANLSGA
jgi:uncharacterized protein YjbI with pentapeptide repeats